MRRDKAIERTGRGTLTRRRMMVNTLASIGVGAVSSSLMSYATAAGGVGKKRATRMAAAIFFESYATVAFRRALRYAGPDGSVASMPQLLHARTNAPYDNIIWNTWFTSNSEESVVTTSQGNRVVVTVHGGGILGSPERFERCLRADMNRYNSEGLTGQYAVKISEREARGLLNGKLHGGSEFPVFQFDEFKRGVADLPIRYGVVMDFELAKKANNGYESFYILKHDPIMIIRAGGVKPLAAYLDKARARHNTKLTGNAHSHNDIDPNQPQTRLLKLAGNKGGVGSEGKDLGLGWGYDADYGMDTDWPGGLARYVAVAPRNVSMSLRYLDFEV